MEKSGSILIKMTDVSLISGEYLLDFAIEQGQGIPVDYYREAAMITITSNINDVGVARMAHE